MVKWLAITLLVLCGFMVIMLGLGYLLSENEQSTRQLVAQLAQEAQAKQAKTQQSNPENDYSQIITTAEGSKLMLMQADNAVLKKLSSILVNNLTCSAVTQCQVVSIKFRNMSCQLVSNVIGAAQVKKNKYRKRHHGQLSSHKSTKATCLSAKYLHAREYALIARVACYSRCIYHGSYVG